MEAARKQCQALAEGTESQILGLRGLLGIAVQRGRESEALALAAQVWALEPKSAWASETLFQMLTRTGDWAQAEEVLRHLIKLKALNKVAGQDRLAVVLYGAAREADLAGQPEIARKQVARALKADRGLVPAAVLAARLEATAGQPSAADKILKVAWGQSPHPDLAEAYEGLDSKATPRERYRRFTALVETNPNLPLSWLTLAEKAVAIEHHEEAATLLKPLLETPYAPQALAMMAEVERGKGGPDAKERAKTWLDRITGPEEGPAWTCSECGATAEAWVDRCGSCGAFASQKWQDAGSPQSPPPLLQPEEKKLTLLPEALETRVDVPAEPAADLEQD